MRTECNAQFGAGGICAQEIIDRCFWCTSKGEFHTSRYVSNMSRRRAPNPFWTGTPLAQRQRDDNTNRICVFERKGGTGGRQENRPKTLFFVRSAMPIKYWKCEFDCREIVLSLRRLLLAGLAFAPPLLFCWWVEHLPSCISESFFGNQGRLPETSRDAWWTFRISFIFSARGGGRASPRRREGVRVDFSLKMPGGGILSEGEGRGAGRVSAANWGIWGGGG